jgi:hypothetical protein
MPKGGAWSNSNKTQMMSNVATVINQGGGDKKAGFPYIVGRSSWSSQFIRGVDPVGGKCCKRENLFEMKYTVKNTVRPVGNDARIKMR